jgi:hypothetical protein
MGRRLNYPRITQERKPKLSVTDEAEFGKYDAAARWLEHAEKRNSAWQRSGRPKRKNKTKDTVNAQQVH